MIPRKTFQDLMHTIIDEEAQELGITAKGKGKGHMKVTAEAKSILQASTETFLVGVFEDARELMTNAHRAELDVELMQLAKKFRANGNNAE